MEDTKELINSMLTKSQEAFLMSIEIYNKPTIKYRLEGFAFFICNAWELMLKAYLIKNKGIENIYYKDKPSRTISLSDCIKTIFTNDKDPVRKNLEIIIELRNTSTHFVIQEMENIYIHFLQANVLNYSQKMYDFFGIDITEHINSSFMTLVTNIAEISDEEILSRYGDAIYKRYLKLRQESNDMLINNSNEKLAINIDLNIKIVKDEKDAKLCFRIAKDGEQPAIILKEQKDVNLTHPFSQKRVREQVEKNLEKKGIQFKLNQTQLGLICNKYNLKEDSSYYYYHDLSSRYGCSQKLIDFLTDLILKNPNICEELKDEIKKQS